MMTPTHQQSNVSLIQHKAIPIAIEGKDIIGVAQSGTGKTLAFAIPVIQRLAQQKGRCTQNIP